MKKKVFGGFVILAVAAAALGYWVAMSRPQISEPTRIYIPADADGQEIQDSLSAKLGGDYGRKVMWLLKAQKGSAARAHGSYVIGPEATALSTSRKLKHGAQTPVKVVINNVRTLPQLSQKVAHKMEFTADDFMAATDSVLGATSTPANYMAHFTPDSYEFYWTASPQQVVGRMVKARDRFWNEERQAKAKALGLTPEQVATLASIVEEETAKADEMPQVARLYLNRLNKGMLLQADPTVKFAVGDFGLRRILNSHLKTPSPYNTYLHEGLPPGPIRLASQQGIDAVLNAPTHTYLYMCAKEDFSGYHNFATTYAEHQANARRYQKELNKRGIK